MLLSRCQHDDVLSRALPKLHHVLVPELKVAAVWNFAIVEHRPIGTLEVNQVRLDLADLVTELVALLRVPELDNSMLLADAGVLCWQVDDGHLSSNQPAAPHAEVDSIHNVLPLEDIQLPLIAWRWFACLRRFMIFERDG